jgi:hypothetical protein
MNCLSFPTFGRLFLAAIAAPTTHPTPTSSQSEIPMSYSATVSGAFDVSMQVDSSAASDPVLGRMIVEKQFHGALHASGRGTMLTAVTATSGSAVYVLIERVEGTLDGRTGIFLLHHTGIMNRGEKQLDIRIVPDSGNGDLTGIAGTLGIRIEGKAHYYDLSYTLPATP